MIVIEGDAKFKGRLNQELLGALIFLTPRGGYAIVLIRDAVSRKLLNLRRI